MRLAVSVLFPVGVGVDYHDLVCWDCGTTIAGSLLKHYLQTHCQIRGLVLCAWKRDQGSWIFGLPQCAMEGILHHLQLEGCCADVVNPKHDPKRACVLL